MQNAMGLLLTNAGGGLRELCAERTGASLPVCGHYRLIDFALSAMANSAITNVAVLTGKQCASLFSYLGAGEAWDLRRQTGGLHILPPQGVGAAFYTDDVRTLSESIPYLAKSRQRLVVLARANTVCNVNFSRAIAFHKEKEADVTVLCHAGRTNPSRHFVLEADREGRVEKMALDPHHAEGRFFGMGMYILSKSLLIDLLAGAKEAGVCGSLEELFLHYRGSLRIYVHTEEGRVWTVDSPRAYFEMHMGLLDEKIQSTLFRGKEEIFTRAGQYAPTRYGEAAEVHHSIVADGCMLEGRAENCIFSGGVHLGKNAHLKNCIVMEKTYIDADCRAENVIFDKNCLMRAGRHLAGTPSYPLVVRKGAII